MPNKNQLMSKITQRIAPYRYDQTKRDEINQEKNQGFLYVDQVDGDLIVIPNDNTDQQYTRHAEPCEHSLIDNDTVDIDQIQLASSTPVTPHLLPPSKSTTSPSILSVINRKMNYISYETKPTHIQLHFRFKS